VLARMRPFGTHLRLACASRKCRVRDREENVNVGNCVGHPFVLGTREARYKDMLHCLVTPTVLTVGFAAAVVTASSVPAAADNDESTGLPRTQDIVEELRD